MQIRGCYGHCHLVGSRTAASRGPGAALGADDRDGERATHEDADANPRRTAILAGYDVPLVGEEKCVSTSVASSDPIPVPSKSDQTGASVRLCLCRSNYLFRFGVAWCILVAYRRVPRRASASVCGEPAHPSRGSAAVARPPPRTTRPTRRSARLAGRS